MADGTAPRTFTITIKGTGQTVPCGETEKVLLALEAATPFPHRPPVRVGCRQGGCGACRVRVLSGDYTTGKMSRSHVSDDEEADGYALSCRLFPASDLVIEPAFVTPQERLAKRQ